MALDTESFELFQSSLQRFIRERLVPAENPVEEDDEVPTDIVAEMKAGKPVSEASTRAYGCAVKYAPLS